MRLHRFYVSQPLGEEVVIDNVSLIHQWKNVFRYEKGNTVVLFNGDGHDYSYSIFEITKNNCSLTRVESTLAITPLHTITLCLALIKKDAFEFAVQKTTELGITSIVPILSSRSLEKNLSLERLGKIAVEAAEQSGRGTIPRLLSATPLKNILETIEPHQVGIILSISAKPLHGALETLKNKEILLFIGPEGGWSEDDIAIMKEKGFHEYSLGVTTLRAETAAIAATSLLIL